MPLEATVCMLDNSDYSINSDVIPTRLEAASDAIKAIFKAKTNSNPESTCGLMTFAGKSPTVLVTPTTDEGKLHVSLQAIKAHGTPDLIAGLSVAGLALKHRQEKNQRQRAIVLLSSPLPPSLTVEELTKLGKKLKKNNVAVDVILFGSEVEVNEERMKAFVGAVESSGNSKILIVPGGAPGLLSDHIKQGDILAEEGLGSGANPGGGVGSGSASGGAVLGDTGGLDIDPNLDPELVMALRMSLQEEEARQAASTRQQPGTSSATQTTSTGAGEAGQTESIIKPKEAENSLSNQGSNEELEKVSATSKGEDIVMDDAEQTGVEDEEELTEEEAIAKAIEMSMKGNTEDQKK